MSQTATATLVASPVHGRPHGAGTEHQVMSEQPRYVTAIPEGLRSYPNAHAFIAEAPERQSRMRVPGDIGGWDVANGFRLTETDLPQTAHSEWRISVLDRMVYAVPRRFPNQNLYTFDGPCGSSQRCPRASPAQCPD